MLTYSDRSQISNSSAYSSGADAQPTAKENNTFILQTEMAIDAIKLPFADLFILYFGRALTNE